MSNISARLVDALDVVTGASLAGPRSHLLPDVIKVLALAQRRDNCQTAYPPPAGTAGLSMLIAWCMGSRRFWRADDYGNSQIWGMKLTRM